jgi:hypothetical protein
MRELINLLVLPLLALIVLALYFYPDRLEDLIAGQDFFTSKRRCARRGQQAISDRSFNPAINGLKLSPWEKPALIETLN